MAEETEIRHRIFVVFPFKGQTSLDFLLFPLQVSSESQASLTTKPRGWNMKRKWPPRFMIALLLWANCQRLKRSWNTGKTSSIRSPHFTIMLNIIKKVLAPSELRTTAACRIRLIASTSGMPTIKEFMHECTLFYARLRIRKIEIIAPWQGSKHLMTSGKLLMTESCWWLSG